MCSDDEGEGIMMCLLVSSDDEGDGIMMCLLVCSDDEGDGIMMCLLMSEWWGEDEFAYMFAYMSGGERMR